MISFLDKAVKVSIVIHFLWFILFFTYIFGIIGLESAFMHPAIWVVGPIYGLIVSIWAIAKKVALVPAILSVIFSIGTFLLWMLVLGIGLR